MYGGRSSEHEISIITALQSMQAIDPLSYEVIPVYLALDGKWYTGEGLYDKKTYTRFDAEKKKLREILLPADPSIRGFVPVEGGVVSLTKPFRPDACLLAFHGQYGEDGCVQGLLELASIPYTGCQVMASSVAMNKTVCKKVAQAEGIPTLPYVEVKRQAAVKDICKLAKEVEDRLGKDSYPYFVKPVHLGSSIGISKAGHLEALKVSLAKALQYDEKALVEPCVTNIMEINVAVLDTNPIRTSVVEIPLSSGGALSYEDKYMRGGSKTSAASQGMASLQRVIDPVDLSCEIKRRAQDFAARFYESIGAKGIARLDFILDLNSDTLYFNEINPIPGSLSFYLWEKSEPRMLYPDLIHHLIESALSGAAAKDCLVPLVGFKALKYTETN
ncbi:D-alanine--D-alanine ligase family protein [Estrella lausannensis]